MPKLNFNVPFIGDNGEPIRRVKVDLNRCKLDEKGNSIPDPVLDADGYVVHEDVMVNELLTKVLGQFYEGDDKMPFEERAARGKLARKVADSTGASTKNYSVSELKTITDFAARIGSTTLLAQLKDIIDGDVAESGEQAAA